MKYLYSLPFILISRALLWLMVLSSFLSFIGKKLNGSKYSADLLSFRNYKYEFVHRLFREHNCTIGKFTSNDTGYIPVQYKPVDNMIWVQHSPCSNDTFILLLYLIYKKDYARRELLRGYIKQGMVVEGKVVNYMFVVTADDDADMKRWGFIDENKQYGDLLVSVHVDNLANITLSVLDGLLWARNYCPQAAYVLKVDGDTFVHLGNLVGYLKGVPRTGFYGGATCRDVYGRRSMTRRKWFIPDDYPFERSYYFNLGWGIILSKDLVPLVTIGTEYIDLIIMADDPLIGDVLSRIGIYPYGKSREFKIAINYSPPGMIPQSVIFVHRLKQLRLYTQIWKNHSSNCMQC